jgi:UMF1 family MFS transporter
MTFTARELAPRRELVSWAMYDFANSGYTTVVLTAIFNTYFVAVIAGESSGLQPGTGTLLWSIAIGLSNMLILLTAPVLGAIADYSANKKRILAVSTLGCVAMTAMLAWSGPDLIVFTMVIIVGSAFLFGTSENFIAAFLPEISPPRHMGRISGYAWALGYVGGLVVLGICLLYIEYAKGHGDGPQQYVPVTMLITAAVYGLAALPTFLFLKERQRPGPEQPTGFVAYTKIGFSRIATTLKHRRQFRDLFRFLLALFVYGCGIYTVIVIAAVYAHEAMGFDTTDTILMIMVVNITAALGAFVFGMLQDRIGVKRTLVLTLLIWITAIATAWIGESRPIFWIAANLIGVAMGASLSGGRALVGLFTPAGRSAEFFGLWGLSMKASAVVGPLSYGFITWYSGGDHRQAILSTLAFFIAGLLLLFLVDESRGREAAAIGE